MKNRFSRWQTWRPSWISNRHDFSYFWSTSHPDASYQVASQLAQGCRRSRLLKQLLTPHDGRCTTHNGHWLTTIAHHEHFVLRWANNGNDQTDLQCQATRQWHHQIQWATCAAWNWESGPHSESEKTLLVWTCGMLQWCSQDSLWHTGWWKKCGPGRPKMTWKQLIEGGSAWLPTLMIDIPGDLVWGLPCMQQASYLEGGPLMWMLPLNLHVNQKSDYDDDDSVRWADNSVKTW